MTRPSLLLLLATLIALPLATAHAAPDASKPNVLFIAIDDMNAWVEKTDPTKPQPKCPNLDKLAARGVTFHKAYCAAPVCNPSRAALMSGLRPNQSSVYNNNVDWRKLLADVPSVVQQFRANGYYAAGCGKIYHEAFKRDSDWDEYQKNPGGDPKPGKDVLDGVGGIKFAPLDCKDEDMQDYKIVSYAIEQLNKPHEKPLFLCCGIHKPHMPWNVPRKYYDMYPLDSFELPKVLDNDLDDIPPAGIRMAKPEGDHKTMLASGRWKNAVQGYLAANTFADMLVGRLIDALDQSPYAKNTVIVLWGDHGWHLGEKQHWRKFALWEEATRMPYIWVVPGMTKPGGICERPVDLMSIYPTLCDLCNVPKPKQVVDPSIRPLLENPAASWDRPALTTHEFGNHAVRSEQYRYIRYNNGDEELYDHKTDPLEWTNLAKKPEFASVKSDLARYLPTVNNPTPKDAITRAKGDDDDKTGIGTPETPKKKKKKNP